MSKLRLPGVPRVPVLLFLALTAAPGVVQADGYRGYTCGDLWLARNDIYANKGYCFKSAAGKATYPNSCFPPYGKLNSFEQNEVNKIKAEERRLRC